MVCFLSMHRLPRMYGMLDFIFMGPVDLQNKRKCQNEKLLPLTHIARSWFFWMSYIKSMSCLLLRIRIRFINILEHVSDQHDGYCGAFQSYNKCIVKTVMKYVHRSFCKTIKISKIKTGWRMPLPLLDLTAENTNDIYTMMYTL